jgi:hypothetical protein
MDRDLQSIRFATTVFAQVNLPLHPSTQGNHDARLPGVDNVLTRLAHIGEDIAREARAAVTAVVERRFDELLSLLQRFVDNNKVVKDPLSVFYYSGSQSDTLSVDMPPSDVQV